MTGYTHVQPVGHWLESALKNRQNGQTDKMDKPRTSSITKSAFWLIFLHLDLLHSGAEIISNSMLTHKLGCNKRIEIFFIRARLLIKRREEIHKYAL